MTEEKYRRGKLDAGRNGRAECMDQAGKASRIDGSDQGEPLFPFCTWAAKVTHSRDDYRR